MDKNDNDKKQCTRTATGRPDPPKKIGLPETPKAPQTLSPDKTFFINKTTYSPAAGCEVQETLRPPVPSAPRGGTELPPPPSVTRPLTAPYPEPPPTSRPNDLPTLIDFLSLL